jgi:hypothetical protein
MSDMSWHFSWDRGVAEIVPAGAMIGPVSLVLDNGRTVQPFAVAPWSNDQGPEHQALPTLLQKLRGEWVGVPFGMPEPPATLPAGWFTGEPITRGYSPHFHGYSSNADWSLVSCGDGAIEMVLDYPQGHPVRRVKRSVRGIVGQSRLEFGLVVETRDAVDLPMGLHPTFRLPEAAGQAMLSFGGAPQVRTYPVQAELGVSKFALDQTGVPLDQVPTTAGGMVDLTHLPLPFVSEELVLVTEHDGTASLTCPTKGYGVRLSWDAAAFPGCMLWISNGGRTAYPWNGRFRAIGIEPVVAPFDLGTDVAQNPDNPLQRSGVPTCRSFRPGEVWHTAYSIEAFPV